MTLTRTAGILAQYDRCIAHLETIRMGKVGTAKTYEIFNTDPILQKITGVAQALPTLAAHTGHSVAEFVNIIRTNFYTPSGLLSICSLHFYIATTFLYLKFYNLPISPDTVAQAPFAQATRVIRTQVNTCIAINLFTKECIALDTEMTLRGVKRAGAITIRAGNFMVSIANIKEFLIFAAEADDQLEDYLTELTRKTSLLRPLLQLIVMDFAGIIDTTPILRIVPPLPGLC